MISGLVGSDEVADDPPAPNDGSRSPRGERGRAATARRAQILNIFWAIVRCATTLALSEKERLDLDVRSEDGGLTVEQRQVQIRNVDAVTAGLREKLDALKVDLLVLTCPPAEVELSADVPQPSESRPVVE